MSNIHDISETGTEFNEQQAALAEDARQARLEQEEAMQYRGWAGDGSGEDDFADYNQNEADDYRDE